MSDDGPGIPAGVDGQVRPAPGSPDSRGLWLVRTPAAGPHLATAAGDSSGGTVTAIVTFPR